MSTSRKYKIHLKGVGHTILETDMVEWMLGTLPTSDEVVYNQVNNLTDMPTLESLSSFLL
jgi:hypothetical protein